MTAFVLKLVAFGTMLVDHTTACLFDASGTVTLTWGNFPLYLTLRGIGRIAFPIFCYMIVEGVIHTKSLWRYAVRLLVFAILSEIPFNLALFGKWWAPEAQNVDFTLLFGLGVVALMVQAGKRQGRARWLLIGASAAATIAAGLIAHLLRTDYSEGGIAQIAVMGILGYFAVAVPGLYLNRWFRSGIATTAILVCSLVLRNELELIALAAVPFIALYNGKRGLKTRLTKWGSYAFYPVHLTLLAAIFVLPKLL